LTAEFDLDKFQSGDDVTLLEESGYSVDLVVYAAKIIDYLVTSERVS